MAISQQLRFDYALIYPDYYTFIFIDLRPFPSVILSNSHRISYLKVNKA
jgi:hypothetical protein